MIDLSCAAGPATPEVAVAYERALAALPLYLTGDGYLPWGLPLLRRVVSDMYACRGLPTHPDQIVITSGALAGIATAVRAMSRTGDRIMVESPVYSNAIDALRLGGGRLVSAPLGDDCWDLEAIEVTLRQIRPRLSYLIPDFQNPTGFLMSDSMRADYARALRDSGTLAIVDETLQPIQLSSMSMPAPFAHYATDAITVGSVSKMYWGGLRVGWLRAPVELVPRLIRARVQSDLGSSLFDQLVAAELLQTPAIVRFRCEQLRQRRDALVQALRQRTPEWQFRVPDGGLTLWLRLPQGSATRLAADAERVGVLVAPGPVFSVEGGSDSWLRLPFAKSESELSEAVERLGQAWRDAALGALSKRRTTRSFIA